MTKLLTEMIAEILSFLPPKSLCRFKSVAKSWHFLITSDAFIKLHLSKTLISDQPPNLIICEESLSSAAISALNPDELLFSAVDHPEKHHPEFIPVEIIGSCHGILCITDEFKKTVFYSNPCTKTHRFIPPAPTKIPASDHPELAHFNPFVVKPIDHFVAFGFGYDSSVDDYKLLRIVECFLNRVRICREVMLYSMRSNSWKNVYDNLNCYCNQLMNAVHINGVLYFAVSDENRLPFIKCFDLKTEEFSVFDMFKYDKSFELCSYTLAELGGCFAVMGNYLKTDHSMQFGKKLVCAELWVRKEVSWVRLFRLSDPFKIGSLMHIKPIVYSKDGGRILLNLDGRVFCWFDWRSNEVTWVRARGIPSMESPFFGTSTFVPSIVSLRSDDDKASVELKDNRKAVPRKNLKKRNSDGFLSTGFKLSL